METTKSSTFPICYCCLLVSSKWSSVNRLWNTLKVAHCFYSRLRCSINKMKSFIKASKYMALLAEESCHYLHGDTVRILKKLRVDEKDRCSGKMLHAGCFLPMKDHSHCHLNVIWNSAWPRSMVLIDNLPYLASCWYYCCVSSKRKM